MTSRAYLDGLVYPNAEDIKVTGIDLTKGGRASSSQSHQSHAGKGKHERGVINHR